MDEIVAIFARVWTDIASGAHAPLSFRLVIQPLVATFFAIRAGMQDARAGRPLFFWAVVVNDPAHRRDLLREGWKHVGKVFIAAVIVDVIYQVIVRHWVYPSRGEEGRLDRHQHEERLEAHLRVRAIAPEKQGETSNER